jgi:hypothetical protein
MFCLQPFEALMLHAYLHLLHAAVSLLLLPLL